MMLGRKMPLHGDGSHRRHYLSARDFAEAIVLVAERGQPGEAYNVGTHEEYTNNQVSGMIAKAFGHDPNEVIEHVPDRPFNDSRYSITWKKVEGLGWRPRRSLATDIPYLVDWYQDNFQRYASHFDLPRNAAGARPLLHSEAA
jgi:dTDP-D-glucose 4,6-dehydratase